MEHPVITQINRTGYPYGMNGPRFIGLDSLGNEIYEDDKVYHLNDQQFAAEPLTLESVTILEQLGAEAMLAK